jgi:diguanylate cyclase (GGDEF)-like protein/PAS domain S-box-containing protein
VHLKFGFEARVLAALILSVGVVAVLTAITWKVADDATAAAQRVSQSHELLDNLLRARAHTVEIELATQSFRISGDAARLAERDAAIAARERLMGRLQLQTARDPVQRGHWQGLRQVLDERLRISRQVEELRRTRGQAAADAFVAGSTLPATRLRVAAALRDMEAEEIRQLADLHAQQLDARQRMVSTGAGVSLAMLVLLGATAVVVRRRFHESESHLRSVIDSVPALIACVDEQQRYVYVNAGYQARFAPDQADITGRTVREVLGEERYAKVASLITQALRGEPQSYDWEPFAGVWQAISYLPRRDAQGRVTGYFVLGTDITGRRRTEQALRSSEQRLARVLDGAEQGYWEWDMAANRFQVSDRWKSMLGYAPHELQQVDPEHWPAIVHPDDLAVALDSIERHRAGQAPLHEAEIRCRTKGGGWRWVLTRGRIVSRTADGTPLLMSGTHTDITERKQFELARREAGVVFENSYEGIMVTDAAGLITKVNPAFTRITGYAEAEVVGRRPQVLSSGRHDRQFYTELWTALTQHDVWQGEIWNRRKDGELYATLQSISAVRGQHGRVEHYVGVFADITPLKQHQAELDQVANFDPLTGLPNRRLLTDRLQQALLRARRSGCHAAVCLLDLDGFKAINDSHGHPVGDRVLKGIADRLKHVLRAPDTLARMGGDEFVLLLCELQAPADCAQILDRVLQALAEPVNVDGLLLRTSASIGVSLYPTDDADPDTLLRHADQAMYLAKQAGKNRYQLFDLEIDRRAQASRDQLAALRLALQRGEFVLHFQPKVDLVNGAVIGVEALLRWQHPERGLLAPGEFLPAISGSDIEHPLGEWVIDTALQQVQAWAGAGLAMPVSVNVSANHLLKTGFCEHLGVALARHPAVQPADLELEVLETAAIEDMQQAVDILQRCMALGVRFSLDDFGTGYSSLSYLRKLPVHTLKIDQSFVRNMLTDPEDLGIVRSVIELASVFHRHVIAEGVETLDHGEMLRDLGCRYAQGYGIARPMPADELAAWRENWLLSRTWRRMGASVIGAA